MKVKLKKLPLVALIGVPVVLWTAGLLCFAETVRSTDFDAETVTEAIVTLTGGTDRVATGADLLKREKAEKLLISGVNQAVDWNLLSRTVEALPEELADRITLGHIACDTWENALESRYWMRKNGFKSLRLVTAAYHMPRSMMNFEKPFATHGIEVIPYACDYRTPKEFRPSEHDWLPDMRYFYQSSIAWNEYLGMLELWLF